ncbi:response regulator transcription factor [Egicoccus sp. AB-alg2]|uniref:response regulator n=1 Tax=Egicoccus sp. AB-alg2 TaxID=3242693 RepID=UPI00359E6897
MRIVVADDDAQVREALIEVLEAAAGLTVVAEVDSADAAIAACGRLRPEAAVLDVRMPGGGAAAARGIRAVSSGTRLVAFSAYDEASSRREMSEAGVDAYVAKGERSSRLIAVVRELTAESTGER